MNTPAHAVFNLVLLGRKDRPQWNPFIIWGALIPDLAMVGFWLWMRVRQVPEAQIWRTEYYQPEWQLLFDFFNSIPLALIGMGVTLYRKWTGAALLFASIILHCLEDLPVHVDDGHRHFWPLSQFRFESPISYWDPGHHGQLVGRIEMVLAIAATIYVFRRVRSRWTKGLLIVFIGLPALVSGYWLLVIG